MKTLDDAKLKDLLPDSIAKDGNVEASAEAIDPQLKLISENADIPSIYVYIDKLGSIALDHLAKQYDVEPWRDSWNVTLKRNVLKTAIADKRKKGTRFAVKQALESLGSAASIVEWFEKEPKGEPHTFTVYATQPEYGDVIPAEMQEDLLIMVDDAKPLRSHYNFVLQESFKGNLGLHGFSRQLAYSRVPRAETGSDDVVCSTPALARNDNANVYGCVFKFSTFGIAGATANITSLTLYRRANATPNGATPLYMRILKKVGNAWVIAAQSENAIAFGSIAIDDDPIGAFKMQVIDGVAPLTPDDVLAIVAVSDPNAAAHTSLQFGCKVNNSAGSAEGGGALTAALNADATQFTYAYYMPAVDIEYVPYGDEISAMKEETEAKLNEYYGYLQNYQNTTGVELSNDFWVEYFNAAERYKKDPTAMIEWNTTKNADGTITSTNPYYGVQPVLPIVDFNVISINSTSFDLTPFNVRINVPIFLPNSKNGTALLRQATLFNSPLIAPNMVVCTKMLYGTTSFNQPLSLPNATACSSMLYGATSFNQPLSLPNATDCSYLLTGAKAFNQPLDLPNATVCNSLLERASLFNQPLSLPNATNCLSMLSGATAFNSSLDLPKATNCSTLLQNAASFNQPLDLPSATNCRSLLQGAKSFNQPLDLPKATNCDSVLRETAFNYSLVLPKATSCNSILQGTSVFNQPVSLPKATYIHYAFYGTVINNPVHIPSCYSAVGAFLSCKMSSQSIAKTLDSLPTWTDGAAHVITFTGCPGAAELTQDSPSVAAAVAKGWTVEL